ncbi:HGxxPAAW family protein [Streptosporangium sp. KLBMP 9127]|nr:hypothetical protein [Streptosporangium sp. KLBMP 9127]
MAGKGHGGRPSSWLAVIVILAGFTVSGVGLTMGPQWLVVWVGAGVIAVGGVIAMVVDIFSDVVLDTPRQMSAEQREPVTSGN